MAIARSLPQIPNRTRPIEVRSQPKLISQKPLLGGLEWILQLGDSHLIYADGSETAGAGHRPERSIGSMQAIAPFQKSFADAGIAGFLNEILPYKAEKAGRQVVKVNPAGTSQHYAMCLKRVPKTLSDRWHNCPHCGSDMPRDINSAVPIKKVGLGVASLKNARPGKFWRRSPRRTA